MSKLVYFSLFLLSSCSKFYDVEKEKGLYVVKDVYAEITQAKEVNWRVGRKKEENVSMGMRFSFSVPKINEHGQIILRKKYGIDSWVFRISRQNRGNSSPVGFFYYPLSSMSASTKTYTFNLYYHAASVSKKFRLFHCPAFDHRYKIGNIDISNRSLAEKSNIYVRNTARVPAKVHRIHINPTIFSIGRKMTGKYFVDFAFYNSETKQRFSNWHKVNKVISIPQENTVAVPSCVGIKEEIRPLPESRMPNIRDLEIR